MTDSTTPEDSAAMPPASTGSLAWIPVGERLPDKSEPVLLWCPPEDDEDTWLTYCDIGRYSRTSNGNHWFDTDDGGAVPTHWMPLPAPPTDAK